MSNAPKTQQARLGTTVRPLPLMRVPLQATPAQKFRKQTLHQQPMQKQSVGIAPLHTAQLALKPHVAAYKPSLPPMKHGNIPKIKPQPQNRSLKLPFEPLLRPQLEPLPSSTNNAAASSPRVLLDNSPAFPATSPLNEPLAYPQAESISADAASSSSAPMPLLNEHPVPLTGQAVSLDPISAAQHPVKTKTSIPEVKTESTESTNSTS